MKNKFKYILIVSSILFPAVSFAALEGLSDLLISFRGLLNLIIPVIFGLAIIYFFWGTVQFILHSGEQKSRDDGKKKMLWGIIALFVMFGIYGILRFVGDIVDIPLDSSSNTQPLPFP
jgi:hypothetical protein